jgi:hypothetical protein
MKLYFLGVVVVLVIAAGGIYFYKTNVHTSTLIACTAEAMMCPDGSAVGRTGPNCSFAPCPIADGYKNATYQIDGTAVTLTNGISEVAAAPGSASKVTTRYFGNDATGDVNADGLPDVAFLLTQDSGGSGIFYYVVVALKTTQGYTGTNAVLLGDRVAPQTTEIKNGQIIINYAERKPNDPMTVAPSVGVSIVLDVQGKVLAPVHKPNSVK